MVVTPDHRPLEPGTPLSPLLLAQRSSVQGSPYVPPLHPSANVSTGSLPPPLRKHSTGSFSKLSDFNLDDSTPGTPFEQQPNGLGLKHTNLSIDASEWRHPVFKHKVLTILRRLNVSLWTHPSLTSSSIHLQRVSGALTNAVFFVSFNPSPTPTSPSMSPLLTPTMPPTDPDHPPELTEDQYPPTLLLRIYGPSSDQLISREEELRILCVLSSQYGLGPKVFGTFLNGRVEQFFPSRALRPEELKIPEIAHGIARRMRELHSVDLRALGYEAGRGSEPMVWRCISDWIPKVDEILASLASVGGKWEVWVENLGFHRLRDELEAYRQWVMSNEDKGAGIVFCHNDTQYGNLLILDAELPKGVPPHHKLIVVDFEYAAPNLRGYDVANHFHEWRANYHHDTLSHSLKPHFPYPTLEQREDWYRAYFSVEMSAGEEVVGHRADVPQAKVEQLEKEVRIWSPACSAFWALWGTISAEEQIYSIVEQGDKYTPPDFDYLEYSFERYEMFRQEARELGAIPK